jgi:hypothetical protein
MVKIWSKYGQNMVKIWSKYGQNMVNVWIHLLKGGKGGKGGNLAINILKIKPFIQNF